MNKKANWQEFEQVLKDNRITKLYHFTDFDNLESIIQNGGLYSWADCDEKGIKIAKPGSSDSSRSLDKRDRLEHYVRLSFAHDHPMKYVAMNEGRISNPVVLEIDLETALWADSLYADRNATKNGANVGGSLDDLKEVRFGLFNRMMRYFDMSDEAKTHYQAEVLVIYHKHWQLRNPHSCSAQETAGQDTLYSADYEEYANSVYLPRGSFSEHATDNYALW